MQHPQKEQALRVGTGREVQCGKHRRKRVDHPCRGLIAIGRIADGEEESLPPQTHTAMMTDSVGLKGAETPVTRRLRVSAISLLPDPSAMHEPVARGGIDHKRGRNAHAPRVRRAPSSGIAYDRESTSWERLKPLQIVRVNLSEATLRGVDVGLSSARGDQ